MSRHGVWRIGALLCALGPGAVWTGDGTAWARRSRHGHGESEEQTSAREERTRDREGRALTKSQGLVAKAEQARAAGQPALALDLYQQAYAKSQVPRYLLAIADCHRAMGNAARAAFSYRQYLKYAEGADNRNEIDDLAQRMEALAAAVRNEPRPDGPAPRQPAPPEQPPPAPPDRP